MRIYLLIVLGSVFPDSFSKGQELKVDVDFRGDDVLQIYSPDAHHCQLACTQHHSCLFFTFIRADWSKDNRKFYCYLKHTATGFPSQVADLKGVTSGFKLKHQDYKTHACLSSTYQDVDFTGSDYLQLTLNTSDDCQKQCTRDPDCKFFSFTTETFPDAETRKKCFLKFGWNVPIPSVLIKTPGLVSGFSDSLYNSKEECKEEIFANTHYRGNDFENVPAASPQHCQFLCSRHPHCTHFTYTTSKYSTEPDINMHCFLKHTQNINQLVSVTEEELFSGFPTRNCKPSNVWATTRYEGLDFLGHDYRDFKTDTSEICREMCTKDPDCQFYTYVLPSYHDEGIRKKCFLKFRWTVPIPSVLKKTPGLVSGFSASLQKTNGFKEKCKEEIFANIHYRGNDFENVPAASPEHCQFLCSTHPHCTHFTYTTFSYSSDPNINMHCFLKHTQNVNQLVPFTEGELFSGFPTRNCKPSNVWATTRYEGLHFLGHDYRDFKTDTSEICQEMCTKDPDCHFYTYALPTYHDESIRKRCFLKFRWNVPIPSVLKKTSGLVSGFSDSLYKTKEECKEEIFANIHYRGNDFENVPAASPQHCQFLCSRHPHCTHFTYTTSKYSTKPEINMHCFLKHTQNINQLVSVTEEELFSGFPTRNCKPSNVWATTRYEGLHFLGYDYRDFKTDTSEICREMCTKDPDCQFYSYVLPSYRDEGIRKKCFLKFRWTVPIPSVLKKTPGLVSGFPDSLQKTNGFKEKCKEEIFANIHYRGNDFENVPAASPEHCQFLCSRHPHCTHFTYTTSKYSTKPDINMHCFLKHTQNVNQLVPVTEEELFSGFPTRNCKPSNVWATTRYEGLDFLGYDYRDFKTDTSEICREMCTKDPDCQFYTYALPTYHDESNRKRCFLKFRWNVPIPSVLIKTPGLVSGFPDSLYKTKEEECKEEIFANTHYRGNDFENVPAASPQHCQFLCSRHPHCTHFTYTTFSYSSDPKINMHCFLKYTQDVSQLVPAREEELFSGFPTRHCKPSNVWATTPYQGLHFLGYDYRDFKTDTSEICKEMCTKDPDCHFYTYVLPTYHDESIRHGCYLKQVMTLPRPEKVVYRLGVLSGFSLRNCKTGGD
ncbi:hypothetical protein PHYPO_G00133390 [Pangasianodon hypophthalmus]|uniref:Apple domain-containing protein n=1 Tax=Pangasianodon hypophthalmus TaxID=310915 RepID=A0A5N5KKC6_PANHP|nr:hypothetical protein PHYPO_G00133390 [Pangasianodon hypophthalmus]